jgi:hypothetical protein
MKISIALMKLGIGSHGKPTSDIFDCDGESAAALGRFAEGAALYSGR